MKNNNTLTLHENFFPGINKVQVSFFPSTLTSNLRKPTLTQWAFVNSVNIQIPYLLDQTPLSNYSRPRLNAAFYGRIIN